MIRFLRAIIKMFKALVKKGLGIFGGSGGPAAPEPDMIDALPDVDSASNEGTEVAGKERFKDWLLTSSPELQVKMFALEPEESRHHRDIDLLSSDQRAWLLTLSEDQLQRVGNATDKQIVDALNGLPLSIPGVTSVGYKSPDLVAPTLAARIATHRSMTSAELNYIA